MKDRCDCHLHIYDPAFPMERPDARPVADAGVERYREVQRRIGTSRAIVVQPAAFGTDPRNGDVLIASIGTGAIRRLVSDTTTPPPTAPPPPVVQPPTTPPPASGGGGGGGGAVSGWFLALLGALAALRFRRN